MAAVDQASYRTWEGTARPSRMAILAIAGTMIRRLMRLRLVRWLVKIVSTFAILISAFFFGLGSIAREGPMGRMFRSVGPEVDQLALAIRATLPSILFFALLLAAVVGAPLVAEDRRARALPLYFSRPITHLDYVLGKFCTLAFFLALLLIAPFLAMYLVEIGFSKTDGIARIRLPTLLNAIGVGFVGTILFSCVSLGVSSLTERTNHAALLFFGLMMLASLMANVFTQLDAPAWQAISPTACLERIAIDRVEVPQVPGLRLGHVKELPVGSAWLGAGLWIAAGLAVLLARIRKVEVVT